MDLTSPLMTLKNQETLPESATQVELIHQLLAIGTALSSSQDLDELLDLILSKSREITCSDAGSVYLIDRSDGIAKLLFKAAQNDSQPNRTLKEFAMPLNNKSLAGYVALTGETLNLPDAYHLPPDVPYELAASFDRDLDYYTRSVLVLPMQDQKGEVIGVLQLINRKIRQDAIITAENITEVIQPYSAWEERVVRLLASQAAISIERKHLQESIENLFESFVTASVQIIEARDPSTYGHSERVAELCVRLSQEVSTVASGSLAKLHFSDRQIQEIRYAALLHDFGKVCVPERILGKRKKLYPEQLEIIRQRFAVAQRTLEMETTQAKYQYLLSLSGQIHHHDNPLANCPQCHHLEQIDTQLSQSIDNLNRYWQLVLEVNEPETLIIHEFEPLSDEALVRFTELLEYKYQDIDGQLKPLILKHEMEQLMVPRGTLTIEERLTIESHVTHSYEFLKGIPWTRHFKDIPLIAYGHHERLDGSGYPQGLKKEEILIQSQILTIADIYDALTASDRPYKQKLPIETALQILRAEAAKNKINRDLAEIFEQRRVFEVLCPILSVKADSAA